MFHFPFFIFHVLSVSCSIFFYVLRFYVLCVYVLFFYFLRPQLLYIRAVTIYGWRVHREKTARSKRINYVGKCSSNADYYPIQLF